ncbi:DUF1287 domain-containing protein [Pseudoalteromonas sp. S1608]|uniref:DUF1287 domain-containing protein n=1 Tax=Pseudoalteromonas sp. S1608 TaxID=579504 RepID=UPI00110A8324|nr:DUF1287 domain-containing protein [Pseudoalteromonas sp. S1608]TMP76336.1 DUF1287 domain-containing protein [Pseudoalteromonas sp. S1608]
MSRFLFYSLALFTFHVQASSFDDDIVNALIHRTTQPVTYDGAYHKLEYPGGDVPANIGVCTDVLIRSYRQLGIDLQKLVHEDMQNNFRAYPSKRIWGLTKPDKNIDHRRVPNLQVYFERHAKVLTKSLNAEDYKAGDIVSWMLPGNLPHIGMVVNEIAQGSGNPLIVHNIGRGPEMSDMLFAYTITGHYRFVPAEYSE